MSVTAAVWLRDMAVPQTIIRENSLSRKIEITLQVNWKVRIVMMPTLPSLAAPGIVVHDNLRCHQRRMMTSSNGNIFRVTGPLCREFTGPGEFPTQRPVTRDIDVFFDLRLINGWVYNREAGDLRRHRGHYDVSVMDKIGILIMLWHPQFLSEITCHGNCYDVVGDNKVGIMTTLGFQCVFCCGVCNQFMVHMIHLPIFFRVTQLALGQSCIMIAPSAVKFECTNCGHDTGKTDLYQTVTHHNTERTIHHYNDVIMGAIASQITSLTIVYSIVYSDADQRKHQSSASLAFVRGIHRGPVNSPHKWPVTRKMFSFDDVIMIIPGMYCLVVRRVMPRERTRTPIKIVMLTVSSPETSNAVSSSLRHVQRRKRS